METIHCGLSPNNSVKGQRYWSVKIEKPVTSPVEIRCHFVVTIPLNCLAVAATTVRWVRGATVKKRKANETCSPVKI